MTREALEITSLLEAVANGDHEAAGQLWRAVYAELHRLAKAYLRREGQRGDLQTTVLIQEAYLRLVANPIADSTEDGSGRANRRVFFAAAANAMRQFLVDDARRRKREKRGGGRPMVHLGDAAGDFTAGDAARPDVRNAGGRVDDVHQLFDRDPAEVLSLAEALDTLKSRDPLKARITELRYFAGLTIDETAEILEVSPRLVDKEWSFARAWLHRELS